MDRRADIQLGDHNAAIHHSEWLLCEQESPIGRRGLVGIRSRIFDRSGHMVASGGAQLMCLPAS